MPNIVELLVGDGINIETSPTDGTVKLVNSSALSDQQRAALNNDKANENNKYLTSSEIDEKINAALENMNGEIPPGPNITPPNFPKLITASSDFVIPQNGRYRIRFCGGGGGGSAGANSKNNGSGTNGADTVVAINGLKLIAYGGQGSYTTTHLTYLASLNWPGLTFIKYDGKKGACSGGTGVGIGGGGGNFSNGIITDPELNDRIDIHDGGNGAGAGGKHGSYIYIIDNIKYGINGGGGGGVISGNIKGGDGENVALYNIHYPNKPVVYYGASGGLGYGTGGGGVVQDSGIDGNHPSMPGYGGAGGGSGYLRTIEPMLAKNTKITIRIGAGGKGGLNSYGNHAGDGAQGAVLIEWISDS